MKEEKDDAESIASSAAVKLADSKVRRISYKRLKLRWLEIGHRSRDESLEATRDHPLHQQHEHRIRHHSHSSRLSISSSGSSKVRFTTLVSADPLFTYPYYIRP